MAEAERESQESVVVSIMTEALAQGVISPERYMKGLHEYLGAQATNGVQGTTEEARLQVENIFAPMRKLNRIIQAM